PDTWQNAEMSWVWPMSLNGQVLSTDRLDEAVEFFVFPQIEGLPAPKVPVTDPWALVSQGDAGHEVTDGGVDDALDDDLLTDPRTRPQVHRRTRISRRTGAWPSLTSTLPSASASWLHGFTRSWTLPNGVVLELVYDNFATRLQGAAGNAPLRADGLINAANE